VTSWRVQAWMYRNDVASNRSSFSVMNVDTKFTLQQVRSPDKMAMTEGCHAGRP
jgi:hypothetical protein